MGHFGGEGAVDIAASEQHWNRQQLLVPVRAQAFRIWIYQCSAIVLGCAQRLLRTTIKKRTAGTNDTVNRDSGGGVVLAGPWLVSVSVVLLHRHSLLGKNMGDAYRGLAELHLSGLENFGLTAWPWFSSVMMFELAPEGLFLDWACFGRISPWEVVSTGGKNLVGMAQKRN